MHQREVLAPPAYLMEPCTSPSSDDTIGGELIRLDWLTRCERATKSALQEWLDKVRKDGTPDSGAAH